MATAKLELSFVISKNGQVLREETLSQGVIKIGKVASAHLRIDDDLASRMHAIVEVVGDAVSVIDLGSTGGTFVNGQKITKATLRSGDAITVGATRIEIAIRDVAGAVAAAPQLASSEPPPIPAIPQRPQPIVAAPAVVAAPIAPARFSPDLEGGAGAVEVAAMLGDTLVGVKHCSDPRGGKVTAATWAFAAGGLACLLASAASFYVSVGIAARNESALAAHVAAHKPARAFRPTMASGALDIVAFGGLAVGLVAATAALARARRERKNPSFRIGTAADVELAIEDAPSPSFPLVAPRGDDFVFNYGAGIDGELIVDGTSTPLCELAAQGRARPSATIAGAIEVPIAANSRIRARAGRTTFVVSAVAAPRQTAASLFTLDPRTLAYIGGSLVAHLGIVWVLGKLPIDSSGVNVEMASYEGTLALSRIASRDDKPPEKPQDSDGGEASGEQGPGATMALAEGKAGRPNALQAEHKLAIKNTNLEPQLARLEAIELAKSAGVFGSVQAINRGIMAVTGTADLSSGMDDADLYAGLTGTPGESEGNFAGGRRDWGPGGGCMREPCGIIGTGRYGTIGPGGPKRGDSYSPGTGGGWDKGRRPGVPPVHVGEPIPRGGLDKAIIKRYIQRSVHKIAYCYESELLARPGIEGNVMVNFMISGTGTVVSSGGNGFDTKVAGCVAAVIKNIEFPRPTDGGTVQVNYPFMFHAAGT